jgi:hypothetical protein
MIVVTYGHHFALYSNDRKQVTQFIPNLVCKTMYTNYFVHNTVNEKHIMVKIYNLKNVRELGVFNK